MAIHVCDEVWDVSVVILKIIINFAVHSSKLSQKLR